MPRSLSPTSFEALLVAQAPAVVRRLRALVGDRETAEDLCQEALSRAWRAAPRDVDPDAVRAWLMRTARNLAVDELRRRARRERYEKLCAFTHAPGYFSQMGFSIVPHSWLLEKIFTDCVKCPHFRRCGQYGMVVPLETPRENTVGIERGHSQPAAAPLG
jgi:RNA polymerase sigma factor (sigma-70 family)